MNEILRYENLKDRFPYLQEGLYNFIQNGILEIRKINYTCYSYGKVCKKYPKLEYANYVIYSPFIDKKDHDYETFIFIDSNGGILEYISGRDVKLYGMLENINGLFINNEYEVNKQDASA